MIIGFGKTETDLEKSWEEKCRDYVRQAYNRDVGYFDDQTAKAVTEWIKREADKLHGISDGYKNTPEFPDRYSKFWPTVIHDASHIVFILKFHHINRRHALSPDGWALMTSDKIFYIDEWECHKSEKAA